MTSAESLIQKIAGYVTKNLRKSNYDPNDFDRNRTRELWISDKNAPDCPTLKVTRSCGYNLCPNIQIVQISGGEIDLPNQGFP